MRGLVSCAFIILLSGCQVFNRPDTVATLSTENTAYVGESTAIALTSQAEGTQVQSTANAAGTVIAQTNSMNLVLIATVRAVVPPTPSRVGASSSSAFGTPATITDAAQFVETRTASLVRDADGCAADSKAQFLTTDGRIYATTRALNIRAGTQMGVQWTRGGEVVWSEDFTVSSDDDDFCIWFYIDPATIAFTPGDWTVRLSANDVPIPPEVAFTIVDGAAGSG